MKKTFLEYYSSTKEDLKELWVNAIFIFDTNVLLNLYRYSDETSLKFLQTIVGLNDRIWLPFQVGLEFHKNRLTVISDQKKRYEDFEKKMNELIDEIKHKEKNPFFSEKLFQNLLLVKDEIKKEIEVKIKIYDQSLYSDTLLDKINSAFEGKVGSNFSIEELKNIYQEGEKRYSNKIPPGFLDLNKLNNEKFGDLVIWKQIIIKAKNDKKDIIFILDDRKDDWWLKHQGKKISPRVELLKEFRNETNKNCHFYEPFQFLEYVNETLIENKIKDEIIEEVKNHKPDNNFQKPTIQIYLNLKGSSNNLNLFLKELTNQGYDVASLDPLIFSPTINPELHHLIISLPNIPDLERRLHRKYITNVHNYNLELLDVYRNNNL